VFASGLANPRGLAFDSSGNLYVANSFDGTVEEFNSNGTGTVFASGMGRPSGIAIQVPEPSTWAMLILSIGTLLGGLQFRRRLS
jgi:glucose/arabinose dehydrogenase